jgi:glutamine amidotransferase PdxT
MLKMKIARNQFGRQFHDSLNAVFPRERERARDRKKERKEGNTKEQNR